MPFGNNTAVLPQTKKVSDFCPKPFVLHIYAEKLQLDFAVEACAAKAAEVVNKFCFSCFLYLWCCFFAFIVAAVVVSAAFAGTFAAFVIVAAWCCWVDNNASLAAFALGFALNTIDFAYCSVDDASFVRVHWFKGVASAAFCNFSCHLFSHSNKVFFSLLTVVCNVNGDFFVAVFKTVCSKGCKVL